MSMFHELMMKKKGMPSRYQEVEYIESDGTQWIQTDYVPNINDVIECDVQKTGQQDTNDAFFFGQQTIDTNKGGLWAEQYGTGNAWYVRFSGISSATYNSSEQDRTGKIHITLDKNRFQTSGGTNIDLTAYYTGQLQSSPLTLFCRWNTAGTQAGFSKIRYWNFQITRNGTLVRNFIPVYDTLTNKYGMWESVQGKFYGNDGTGDFKGSIVGYTVVGSPTITDGVVSGFSNSNYLQINSGISVGQNFEIYTKFTTGASLSSNQELIAGKKSSDLYLRIFIQNGATLFTSARVVGASSISHNQTSYSFQTNTTYFVKVKYDGANKLDVFIYDNTGQQVKTNSFTLSNQINTFNSLLIGTVGTPSSVWGGSIDLNETYIKVNGKLWFNGQQA